MLEAGPGDSVRQQQFAIAKAGLDRLEIPTSRTRSASGGWKVKDRSFGFETLIASFTFVLLKPERGTSWRSTVPPVTVGNNGAKHVCAPR